MTKRDRCEHPTLPAPPMASGTYRRVPLRPVLERPASLLTRRARSIDPRAPGVLKLAEELITTMRASPACIGLAAPQIGESVRVFVMDVTGHRHAKSCAGLVLMVNPRIVERAGWVETREGCMSVPDLTGDVWRYETVVVEGFEPGSTRVLRITADAMEARCVQHEIDHLDGFTFVERTEKLFARKTYAGTTPQSRCRD